MYRLSIFFKHGSEERVRESCNRVTGYVRLVMNKSMDYSIEAPDTYNEEYLSRSYMELSDRQVLGVIAECFREEYCEARILFVRKGYSPAEGCVEGNAWGATLSGPLDDVYRIAKKLKRSGAAESSTEWAKTRPTRYSHLKLVE